METTKTAIQLKFICYIRMRKEYKQFIFFAIACIGVGVFLMQYTNNYEISPETARNNKK